MSASSSSSGSRDPLSPKSLLENKPSSNQFQLECFLTSEGILRLSFTNQYDKANSFAFTDHTFKLNKWYHVVITSAPLSSSSSGITSNTSLSQISASISNSSLSLGLGKSSKVKKKLIFLSFFRRGMKLDYL